MNGHEIIPGADSLIAQLMGKGGGVRPQYTVSRPGEKPEWIIISAPFYSKQLSAIESPLHSF